jgi:hypothetical protein
MKSEVYRRKVDTWDELLDRIVDATARIKERQDELRRATQHAMFSHELKSALMLMAGFSKMYYKLTNLSLEQ